MSNSINDNGKELVDQFKDALIMRSSALYASEEAVRSENETVSGLDAISRGNYLNPSSVPEDLQNQIARASVDAHIKKVQAKQLNENSKYQLEEMKLSLNEKFNGKKIKVTVLNKKQKPIESIWYDPKFNDYYNGILDTNGISGKIQEILLDKNAILVKPNFLSRISASNRKLFMVFIINPDDLLPLVSLEIN
jgi:hypothetical protein